MSDFELRELGPGETQLAFEAMRELRPHYPDEDGFVARVDDVQRAGDYRLVAAFLPGEERAGAVAGFRLMETLPWGRALYVDDLSTHPDARRRGLAGALMRWLLEEARRLECDGLHLDSGVQPERQDAHRLYFNHGLRTSSYHFQIAL